MLFPNGIDIAPDLTGLDEILERIQHALRLRQPLFEAALPYDVAFARVEILNLVGQDQRDIVEVAFKFTPSEPLKLEMLRPQFSLHTCQI